MKTKLHLRWACHTLVYKNLFRVLAFSLLFAPADLFGQQTFSSNYVQLETTQSGPNGLESWLKPHWMEKAEEWNSTANKKRGNSTISPALVSVTAFSSVTTPQAIPENTCSNAVDGQGGVTDVITTSGLPISLDGVNLSIESVCIEITHPFIGDIQASLVAPDGTRMQLWVSAGGAGDDIDFCLTPTGANGPLVEGSNDTSCNGANPPCYIGNWQPDNGTNDFSDVENGSDPNGAWTLEICDGANQDVGQLEAWSISFSCPPSTGNADYTIDNPAQVNACTGIFADSGNTDGDYGDSESFTKTFCSDQSNQISFSFEHFNLATGDELEIFDGNTTGAASLGVFSGFGQANSPGVVTSSGTCLTFEFTSNGSDTAAGWEASISCTGAPDPPPAVGTWTGYDDVGSNCVGNEEIGGTVFEDIDQDGQLDNSEASIPNVTVTLYDDSGQVGGPTTTDGNGDYSFTGLVAGNVYRVEFSIPSGFSEGVHGTGSSTAVQFVDAGSCDVNFGLADPSHYCNAEVNPTWMVPCYANGDPQHSSNINETGVASFEYTASGDSPHATYVNYVTAGAVGSTWGAAHDADNNMSYFGAVLKRHVGLGPGGIGAIYNHGEADANNVAPVFYDFGAAAGTIASNATRFPGTGSMFGQEGPCGACDNIDPTTFSQVGKTGFGDLEIGPDNEFLYATNLADRKVYKINIDNPIAGSATPLPGMPWLDNSICNNGVARPWALEFRRGKLYVGLICDASTSSCSIGSACSDLTASIYSFDGSTWTSELSFPLDYYREAYASGSDYFVRWIDDWNTMAPFVENVTDANFGQPILMDIEFDDDNSIVIGIGDRSGLQMGYQAPNPTAGSGNTSERSFAFGDILRASYNSGSGTYTLENNGSVGGLTTTNPNSSSGPGGKSFYWGDYFTGIGANRWQAGVGSLGLLPCSGEVMFPVADAIDYYSNGVVWMSSTNGSANRKLEVYQGSSNGNSANFAKGVGLGDLEFVREDPASIEVGNSVWWDENADGLQDPSEAGIPGITIQLWKDNGSGTFSQVAETTTDGFGRYIFSNSTRNNGLDVEDWGFSADNAVLSNTNYEIRIANWNTDPAIVAYRNGLGLGYLNHLISPTENQGAGGIERDNNAADVASNAVASLTTGGPSQNNHSYDFAFYGEGGCIAPEVIPTANTPCADETLNLMAAVSGGENPYSYNWTGPASFSSNLQNPSISSVDATLNEGTYNLTVTDNLGCTEEVSIEVFINEVDLSLVVTDANCGNSDGAVDLTITGQAPFMINWDNDGTVDPNDDPEDLTGLAAGTYAVIVIDGDGCQATENANIDESGAPTLVATPTAATCGQSNGSIDLMISGVAATNIDWDNDGVMGDSDPEDLTGLAAGTYTVIVVGGGCEATLSVVIEDTPVPSSSFTQVNTTCGDSNGSIDLSVSGGTPPYEYDWDTDAANDFDDPEDLSGLSAGMYNVTVRDANGCTTTESITITDTPGPTLMITSTTSETCGGSNGAVDLSISDGTPAYTILWSNGLTTEDLTGVGEGTYDVTVTDANGCVATASATVTNTEGPTLMVTPTAATNCITDDGTVTLDITGGTAAFMIDWDDDGLGDNDDMEDRTGLIPGSYTVIVTDANGCTASIATVVGDASEPVLNLVVTDPTTCTETGSIDLTITGSDTPYTIDWSNDGLGDNDDMEDLTGLDGGAYSVIVTGANGCTTQANASIVVIRPPSIVEIITDPTCGNTDGSIDIEFSDPDGSGPYTFDWTFPGAEGIPGAQDQTGLGAGNYSLTITNGIGCSIDASFILSADTAPELTLIPTSPNCGGSDGSIDMTIAGGTPPYQIDWDNNGLGDTNDSEDLTGLSEGTYSVTVTDAISCEAIGMVTLISPDPSVLNAVISPENCTDADGSIDLMISGIGPFQIDWDNNGTGDIDDSEDLSGLSAGMYAVTVTDGNGCSSNTSVTVPSVCPTCSVTGSIVSETCDGMGTPNTVDDTYTIVVTATVTNGSGSYDVLVDGVEATANITSGMSTSITVPASGGTVDITFRDATDDTCVSTAVTSGTLSTCSPAACSVTGSIVSETCDGMGTSDPSDDTYAIVVTATVSNGSGAYDVLLDGVEATANITSGMSTSITVPASGGTVDITFRDATDDTCVSSAITSGALSTCSPADVSLGSTVFIDSNNNGVQDVGEVGIEDVVVQLFNDVGTEIEVGIDGVLGTFDDGPGGMRTNPAGDYFFTGLPAGDYYVQIPVSAFSIGTGALENVPISSNTSSGTFAGETDPDSDDLDNDDEGLQVGGSATVVISNIITLTSNGEPTDMTTEIAQGNLQDNAQDANGNMTLDFGFFGPASLGDTTFVDLDQDGLQGPTEPRLQGVSVTLFNSDGTPVTLDAEGNPYTNTVLTDSDGYYQFTNLPPGNYYVVFDLSTAPGNEFYEFTINTGGVETDDSDADPVTGQTDDTGAIASGENFPDLDAGVICNITAEAGTGQTICSTESVDLTTLGASFTPTGVTGFGATWTSSTGGTFDDGAGEFGVATTYTISAADIAAGEVLLTLTTDDPSVPPFNATACGPATDEVLIIILNVNCGTFPWGGN